MCPTGSGPPTPSGKAAAWARCFSSDMGVPVVPVAIRGTRAILREDSWFARRGAVAVPVGAPVSPEGMVKEGAGDPWAVAVRLRDAARAEILRHCGEPDLVDEWSEIFAGGKMSA